MDWHSHTNTSIHIMHTHMCTHTRTRMDVRTHTHIRTTHALTFTHKHTYTHHTHATTHTQRWCSTSESRWRPLSPNAFRPLLCDPLALIPSASTTLSSNSFSLTVTGLLLDSSPNILSTSSSIGVSLPLLACDEQALSLFGDGAWWQQYDSV